MFYQLDVLLENIFLNLLLLLKALSFRNEMKYFQSEVYISETVNELWKYKIE